MAPLIEDGVYKIRNGEFRHYVADLIDGIPMGPICAYTEHRSNKNDRWRIKNHKHGNQVTIESASVHGSFANAEELQGASLVGSKDHSIWTVVKADGGMYYLQCPDAKFVWELPEGADRVNIRLVRHNEHQKTKWFFDRVEPCA